MKSRKPRSGSMQFWPRKRAKRIIPRVRSWVQLKDAKPLAFAGYKVGMTHVMGIDNRKVSTTKGMTVAIPTTIIECPPIKIYSARFYKKSGYGEVVSSEIPLASNSDCKDLKRKLDVSKTPGNLDKINPVDYSDITVQVFTQPKLIGFKKKPDFFEVHLGGSNEEKLTFIKNNVGKDIPVSDVFGEGDYFDIHAITTGKGFQGAVKRFGIGLKSHKSEKGRRAPGSLGGWKGHAHFMYRIAHAGQMGFHQRVQYNNPILKIGEDFDKVNPLGGFVNYGIVKNTYLLVKGSVPGPKKRLIVMTKPVRSKVIRPVPTIKSISTKSQQSR